MISAVQRGRLRHAARVLDSYGIATPAISEAIARDQWPPMLETQLLVDIHWKADAALQLGVDVDLLPPIPENPPMPGTFGQVAAVEPVLELPTRTTSSAAEIVAPQGTPLDFDGSLDSLKGVPLADIDGMGEKNQERLGKMGLKSVFDLLHHIPLRYLDRGELSRLAELRSGMKDATFAGVVSDVTVRHGRTPYVRFTVADGGHRISCMFFRAAWMAHRFKKGDTVLVYGDVSDFNGSLTMSNPIMEVLTDTTAPMVSVYPQSQTHRVNTWLLRRAAIDALRRIPTLDDPVPEALLKHRQLMSRLDAFKALHVPSNATEATWGRERVVYDEFLRLQLSLGVMAYNKRQEAGISHQCDGKLLAQWRSGLPYALTGAQDRAIEEISADMRTPRPMNRLLQGDVGAGKTAVLVGAALNAIEAGHQAVIVAPSGSISRKCSKLYNPWESKLTCWYRNFCRVHANPYWLTLPMAPANSQSAHTPCCSPPLSTRVWVWSSLMNNTGSVLTSVQLSLMQAQVGKRLTFCKPPPHLSRVPLRLLSLAIWMFLSWMKSQPGAPQSSPAG